MTPERKRVLIVIAVLVVGSWLVSTTSSSKHPPANAAATTSSQAPTTATGSSSELDAAHHYCLQQVLADQPEQAPQPPLRCFDSAAAAAAIATASSHRLLGIDFRDTHNRGDRLYWYATSSCAGHRFRAPVPAGWADRISSALPAASPSPDRCGHWLHYDKPAGAGPSVDCGFRSTRAEQPPCHNLDLPGGGSLNDRTSAEEWH
ncbi:MAG: hypothetical protein ABI140_18955 [Jatrophihabitantaceae bacterium]